jgi:hypothetical protein
MQQPYDPTQTYAGRSTIRLIIRARNNLQREIAVPKNGVIGFARQEIVKALDVQEFELIFSGRAVTDKEKIEDLKLTDGDFLLVHEQSKPLTDRGDATPTLDNTAVAQLCELGFEETLVKRALQAARNDADEAAGFLLSGNIPIQPPPAFLKAPLDMVDAPTLSFLRYNPQFIALKAALRSDPGAMGDILARMGDNNPDLLQIMNANSIEFVRLLGEEGGVGGTQGVEFVPTGQNQNAQLERALAESRAESKASTSSTGSEEEELQRALRMSMGQGDGGSVIDLCDLSAATTDQSIPMDLSASSSASSSASASTSVDLSMDTLTPEITLTKSQNHAVNRLVELGFGHAHVIEVFVACGRDEQRAANSLLEQLS